MEQGAPRKAHLAGLVIYFLINDILSNLLFVILLLSIVVPSLSTLYGGGNGMSEAMQGVRWDPGHGVNLIKLPCAFGFALLIL